MSCPTPFNKNTRDKHNNTARNGRISDIEYRKIAHGNVIHNMTDEECWFTEKPVDEITQGAAGNHRKPYCLPLFGDFRRINGDPDHESDLNTGEQPGGILTHRKRRAWVKEQAEAEPISDNCNDLAWIQPVEHEHFNGLVNGRNYNDYGSHHSHIMASRMRRMSRARSLLRFHHRTIVAYPSPFAPHGGRLVPMTFRASRRPSTRLAALMFATATALCLSACTQEEERQEIISGPEVDGLALADVDAPKVTLIDAGANPTHVLEYKDAVVGASEDSQGNAFTVKVSDGFNQQVLAASAVNREAPAGGDVSSVTLPLRAATVPASEPAAASDESPVQEREADRDVEIRVGVPRSSDPQHQEALNSAEGFLVGWRALNSGEQSTLRLGAPATATEQGRALAEGMIMRMLNLPIVFPTQAVGPGGVWKVDSRVTGESTLLQTTTYTLKSVDGDRVELDVSVEQRPAVAALDLSAAPGSEPTSAEETSGQLVVTDSSTTSTGRLTVDLTKPLPVGGQVAWTTRVIYGGENTGAQERDIRVVQDTTTGLEFSEGN